MVYVHATEANDHWNALEREGYGFSPAIEIASAGQPYQAA
jgi:hypothetical protein